MGFTIVQSGSALQRISPDGATTTTLTLPTGITLLTDRPPRFAVFGRYIIVVNTPTRPITADSLGTVRVLTPYAPPQALTIDDDGGAGALTGDYKARQTHVIRDIVGNVIAESDYGPLMPVAFTASADTLNLEDINISPDAITGNNIYRTLAGGSVYFKWRELDGNIQTISDSDDLADAALSVFAAPLLGSAPNLTHIAEWRGRLWGVDRTDIDYLRSTEVGQMYAWPAENQYLVPKLGEDSTGITALVARREAMVLGRRNTLHQVIGNSSTDFRIVKLSENVGIESQESAVVFRDTAFWLWKDGVYKWDTEGVKNISDGQVRKWFTTDDYFNRAEFDHSFAMVDQTNGKYRLFLCSAGETTIDRWVEYDFTNKTWWGPHKTDAFTTSCAFVVPSSDDILLPMIGSTSGFLFKDQSTATDLTSTGIDFNVDTKFHDNGAPTIEHYWGALTVVGKAQTAGTVTITPKVGSLEAIVGAPLKYLMYLGTQGLRRLGVGALLQLNFRHTANAEPVELYGYEVDDVHEIGRR